MLKILNLTIITLLFSFSSISNAQTSQATQSFDKLFQTCLFNIIKKTNKDRTLKEIESYCEKKILKKELGNTEVGVISERMIKEQQSAFNPYVITPHKMNYILPISITDSLNKTAYENFSNWDDEIKDIEAKFQLSIKVPLTFGHIFNKSDQLFFGFTLESWWQLYTEKISRPFRETNYQPEIFYFTPTKWHPFKTNSALIIGFEHQSNGRSQLLSRSWNRVYLNFLFEKNNLAVSFRPWYRIPEGDKLSSADEVGDDNPDIDVYMGHFELGVTYDWQKNYQLSMKLRENFSKHKGSIEMGITFPLWGKLKGFAQYFSGYGESLIDYNHKQQRLSIGLALTEIL